jgi:NADH:ubiquinone oxidoreductase subunit
LYDQSSVPAQWRAWLSHTRNDVPTLEEVEEDLRLRALIRDRAMELDRKWTAEKQKLEQSQEFQRQQATIESLNRAQVIDWEAQLTPKQKEPVLVEVKPKT